jgi:ADP-heptose:LPS heptosyltransferase
VLQRVVEGNKDPGQNARITLTGSGVRHGLVRDRHGYADRVQSQLQSPKDDKVNISAMRRVDRWLGLPLCILFSGLRKVIAVFAPSYPHKVSRILFVKLAEQGSTVLTYPILKAAVDKVGRENVFFLAFEENRFILDAMQVIPPGNVITLPTRTVPAAVLGSLKVVLRLRQCRVDTALDLEFFSRATALFCFLSGARTRVGFHAFHGEASYRGDLMTHRLHFNSHLHTTDLFLTLLAAAEANPEELPAIGFIPPELEELSLPMFTPAESELAEIRALLERLFGGKTVKPLLLLNANCSDFLPLRKWDSENYIEIAKRFLAEYPDGGVIFTGGPEEQFAGDQLAQTINSEHCISLAGRTSLRQLLTLYHVCDLLVTNDSGPAHFAALTPTNVITLFGPETPALFAARTQRNQVIYSGLACSPCVNAYNDRQSACRNNLCMQSISVDTVFAAIRRVL